MPVKFGKKSVRNSKREACWPAVGNQTLRPEGSEGRNIGKHVDCMVFQDTVTSRWYAQGGAGE